MRLNTGQLRNLERTVGVETAGRRFLMSAVVPLWLGAGFADWCCHRRTNIETTSGTRESAIHALMMTEAGIPAALGLFCEANAGVLALAWTALGAHEATAIWDVSFAEQRREVTPTEQHIHGLLEVVPLMATAFLTVLHWDQALALMGRRPADLRLRRKRWPLSRRYRIGFFAGIATCIAAPYVEELVRCVRAERATAGAMRSAA